MAFTNTYAGRVAYAQDPSFTPKVVYSIAAAATLVLGDANNAPEPATTPNHAARVQLARIWRNDPWDALQRVALAVVLNPGITDTSTDSDIAFTVNGLINSFAGGVPVPVPLLATGAGHTVDDVISALQAAGVVRQS